MQHSGTEATSSVAGRNHEVVEVDAIECLARQDGIADRDIALPCRERKRPFLWQFMQEMIERPVFARNIGRDCEERIAAFGNIPRRERPKLDRPAQKVAASRTALVIRPTASSSRSAWIGRQRTCWLKRSLMGKEPGPAPKSR